MLDREKKIVWQKEKDHVRVGQIYKKYLGK